MPAYRVYVLTKDNRVIGPPKIIECRGEQEALVKAQEFAEDHDVELWDGARLIARLPATQVGH